MFLQKTVKRKVEIKGYGIHSGEPCTLSFCPAPVDTGVYLRRVDLPNKPYIRVAAQDVTATSQATTLGNDIFQVSTVEHCLSALSALRIDNLLIDLDGSEIPIGDGSSKTFLDAIQSVGLIEQDQPRKYCLITEPIQYSEGEKQAYVVPYQGLRLTVTIDFAHPKIGKQVLDLDINEKSFEREIAPARTFGFLKDLEILKSKGLAKGGSLENAIGLTDTEILNPEGLRFPDEFVRHKALDALGDLVTLQMPLMGHVVLYKAGHDIMNKLVKKILQTPQAYRHVELCAPLQA